MLPKKFLAFLLPIPLNYEPPTYNKIRAMLIDELLLPTILFLPFKKVFLFIFFSRNLDLSGGHSYIFRNGHVKGIKFGNGEKTYSSCSYSDSIEYLLKYNVAFLWKFFG